MMVSMKGLASVDSLSRSSRLNVRVLETHCVFGSEISEIVDNEVNNPASSGMGISF